MSRKLYVGGLNFATSEAALHDLFAQVGDVESARVITDRESGRSKGFGFVEMAEDDAAQQAIEKYNGQEFEGRRLTVNEARPQAPRTGGGGGGQRGGGDWGGGGSRGGGNRW